MSKPALGKGLGQLMAGQPAARKAPSPGAAPAGPVEKVTAVDFGRGFSTLVSARRDEKIAPAQRPFVLLPSWFFFTADLLLLAFTVAICLGADTPLQTGEVIFGGISTGLGALLSIFGVLRLMERGTPEPDPKEK